MVATLIGAGVALASAIAGAVSSSNKNKEAQRLIQQQRDENKKWYNARMNEDYTQRADNQAILNRQRELLDEHYKKSRASQVVGGASDESVALQKEAAAKSLSDTASNMAAQGAAYKDSVEQAYKQGDNALNQQQAAAKQQEAQAVAQAAGQAANAGVSLIGANIGKGATAKVPTTSELNTISAADANNLADAILSTDINAPLAQVNNGLNNSGLVKTASGLTPRKISY